MINKIKGKINIFMEFMDEAIVIWAIWLITLVIFKALDNWTTMTLATNAFVTIVVGLLATAIAFNKWSRSKENKND